MPGVAAGEEHAHQPAQERGAVDVRQVGLQQKVYRRLGNRRRQDGECLHDLLRPGVEAVECLSHQYLHHIFRQQAFGFRQHLFQGGAAIGGENALEGLQRVGIAPSALPRQGEQLLGGVAQPQSPVGIHLPEDVLRIG